MATFRCGMRVRLVRPLQAKHKGDCGTLIALFPEQEWPYMNINVNCAVKWDDGYHQRNHHTDNLEPIVDDGHQVISWADMKDLWQPKEVTA